MEDVLKTRYMGNISRMAEEALQMSASGLNQLISRKNRVSYQTAEAFAAFMRCSVQQVLGERGFVEPELSEGLRVHLDSVEKGTYSEDEIVQAARFRDLGGVDLSPDRWGKYLRMQRSLQATLIAEQQLEEAGLPPDAAQAKTNLRVVHDDPIEERKAKKSAKKPR